MSNTRKMDRIMISSSDVRQNTKSNMIMINKLKPINKNIIVNTSDSGEEVEEGGCFLKVGALTAL